MKAINFNEVKFKDGTSLEEFLMEHDDLREDLEQDDFLVLMVESETYREKIYQQLKEIEENYESPEFSEDQEKIDEVLNFLDSEIDVKEEENLRLRKEKKAVELREAVKQKRKLIYRRDAKYGTHNIGRLGVADSIGKSDFAGYESPEFMIMRFFSSLVAWIVTVLSWIAFPFTRFSFGERAFSWIYSWIIFFGLYSILGVDHFFPKLYLAVIAIHGFWIFYRKRLDGDAWWYSYSYGVSISYLLYELSWHKIGKSFLNNIHIREQHFAAWIDPILFLLGGFLFASFNAELAQIFMVGALAMFLREQLNIFSQRVQILDERDILIKAEAKTEHGVGSDLELDDLLKHSSNSHGLKNGFRNYEQLVSVESAGVNNNILSRQEKKEEKANSAFEDLQNKQSL